MDGGCAESVPGRGSRRRGEGGREGGRVQLAGLGDGGVGFE